MEILPDRIIAEWEKKEGPVVLTTVDKNGLPNSIYATCVSLFESAFVLIADNYFSKTRQNILEKCSGSVLFITNEKKAYQIKGRLEYHKDGRFFTDMKKWNPEKHPGHAVAVLVPEAIYSGSEKIA
ncbi:MAG: pyridoxamine 5'-phosphate oxidase family protein [Spirochaetales bacterium]|nr:pyridoxamine 5'-phosphate oxidase family protein [Spirochaetales bacterium]